MKDNELKNRVVSWLLDQAKLRNDRPLKFEPKHIAEQVGGLPNRVGVVRDDVLKALAVNGINAFYENQGNKRYFVLLNETAPPTTP